MNKMNLEKYRICDRKNIPQCPHYQMLTFSQRVEWTPRYDYHDPQEGTSTTIPHVNVYCFTTISELNDAISLILKSINKEDFVFYRVEKLGDVNISVSVSI